MKRDKKRKTMQETLSSLDSVLVALNSYPEIEDALLAQAQTEMNKYLGQMFPTQLDFAKDILEHLVGTDVLIDIVSKFLTVALPGVEIGVKAALLANMQNLGTNCTIDPFIYEKAIKEGIVFDLRQIDLYDKLTVSPLDRKIGKYFYFGVEDCESSYDVLKSAIDPNNQTEKRKEKRIEKDKKPKEGTSFLNRAMNDSVGHYFGGRKRDFDCLLWYMKNKSVNRQVWGKRTSESESIFSGNGNIQDWINKKGYKKNVYYQIDDEGNVKFFVKVGSEKRRPSDGEMVAVKIKTDYVYEIKNTRYRYSYGKPSISKLSRNKVYYNEKSPHVYEIYSCVGGKWKIDEKSLENYLKFEDIPIEKLKKDNFIVVDRSLYVVRGDAKTKDYNKKDKNGNPYTETIAISAKTEECIDVTNSLDLTLYIDYEEEDPNDTSRNKGEAIKAGVIPASTFAQFGVNLNEDVKQQWFKTKLGEEAKEAKEEVKVKKNYCYFIDNDKDGKYTEGVDKIIIPPHTDDGFCVNVNDKKAKKNKYTKEFGVVTLEYSPRTGNVLQSDGKPMPQQTPYDNVLHVFFGNVKELSQELEACEATWAASSDVNKVAQKLVKKFVNMYNTHIKSWRQKQKQWKKDGTDLILQNRYNQIFNTGYKYYVSILSGGKINDGKSKIEYVNNLPLSINDISFLEGKVNDITNIVETYKKQIYSLLNNEKTKSENEMYVTPKKPSADSSTQEKETEWNEFNPTVFYDFKGKIDEALKIEDTHYTVTSIVDRIAQIMNTNEDITYLRARDVTYPEANKNYYLWRTLFEFNTDYINSLQLFDPKVLAAQLITSLMGGLSGVAVFGATNSWKSDLIRGMVQDMVEKQIAAEDFAVSDCFFTFTNDAYNGMLRATELHQAGLYSQHGEENSRRTVDPVKMLEGLNEMDKCADQAEQTTVIKYAIMQASGVINTEIENVEDSKFGLETKFGLEKSFFNQLMINLCTQMVMAILSPKVYLLILINLEMFGLSTNFDLESFFKRFSNLIRSIIKSVVDQFMQFLSQEIMKIVEELLQKLIVKLSFEQVEMYARLIKQILMHLRMLTSCGQGLSWNQDVVEYADITDTQGDKEPIDEC